MAPTTSPLITSAASTPNSSTQPFSSSSTLSPPSPFLFCSAQFDACIVEVPDEATAPCSRISACDIASQDVCTSESSNETASQNLLIVAGLWIRSSPSSTIGLVPVATAYQSTRSLHQRSDAWTANSERRTSTWKLRYRDGKVRAGC